MLARVYRLTLISHWPPFTSLAAVMFFFVFFPLLASTVYVTTTRFCENWSLANLYSHLWLTCFIFMYSYICEHFFCDQLTLQNLFPGYLYLVHVWRNKIHFHWPLKCFPKFDNHQYIIHTFTYQKKFFKLCYRLN